MSVIYKIEIMGTDKVYVGRTINFKNRVGAHYSNLRRDSHHNKALQNYYNKYGSDKLKFSIVEECPEDQLSVRELEVFKEINDSGKQMVNAVGFVGQDIRISKNGRIHKFSEEEYMKVIAEVQFKFLKNVLEESYRCDLEK